MRTIFAPEDLAFVVISIVVMLVLGVLILILATTSLGAIY